MFSTPTATSHSTFKLICGSCSTPLSPKSTSTSKPKSPLTHPLKPLFFKDFKIYSITLPSTRNSYTTFSPPTKWYSISHAPNCINSKTQIKTKINNKIPTIKCNPTIGSHQTLISTFITTPTWKSSSIASRPTYSATTPHPTCPYSKFTLSWLHTAILSLFTKALTIPHSGLKSFRKTCSTPLLNLLLMALLWPISIVAVDWLLSTSWLIKFSAMHESPKGKSPTSICIFCSLLSITSLIPSSLTSKLFPSWLTTELNSTITRFY